MGTLVWAYCLMPNHVHLGMVPAHVDGLRAAARLCARDDGLLEVGAMLSRVDKSAADLSEPRDGGTAEHIATHSRTGARWVTRCSFTHLNESRGGC